MRTMVKLRVVSQKLIFDEVDASFAASASRFKYSTSVKKKERKLVRVEFTMRPKSSSIRIGNSHR